MKGEYKTIFSRFLNIKEIKAILSMQSFLKHNLVQSALFPDKRLPVQEDTASQTALS